MSPMKSFIQKCKAQQCQIHPKEQHSYYPVVYYSRNNLIQENFQTHEIDILRLDPLVLSHITFTSIQSTFSFLIK